MQPTGLALLLAEASSLFDWLDGMPWFGWIAIVAIVTGCVTGTINNMLTHRQRMAMIRQGLHPDTPPPAACDEAGVGYKTSHPEL